MTRRVALVTGTRAEYGLLQGLMKEIQADPDLDLQLVVTGMHLAPEFGLTWQDIEKDGFTIDRTIDMLLSSDTPLGTAKSMGLGMIGLADALSSLAPDIVVLLGDRFEMLSAAAAALVLGIPIAHIHGGEITLGAMDDAIRHGITKMSHLHFTAAEPYRKRVVQLGEDPARVYNVGALGVENIRQMELMDQAELEDGIGMKLGPDSILVTFHPVTLEPGLSEPQFNELLSALDERPGLRILFTAANADAEGRKINAMIETYVAENKDRSVFVHSLGQKRYLGALNCIGAMVGNSSSGLVEAPSFGLPTINIGRRQEGRIRAATVIDVPPERSAILAALDKALSKEFRESVKNSFNPYESPDTARRIKDAIKETDLSKLCPKMFYDLPNDGIILD
jgi:GDP/UDP-N,N'-diacetylbacillosamine 2-epimerase (hydrolysing)